MSLRTQQAVRLSSSSREAFPYEAVPKFLVLDHDAKYGFAVPATIESMKLTPVRTSIGSPWQYHEERTHLGLEKQTAAGRARSLGNRQVICQQRLGGLHHRYDRAA